MKRILFLLFIIFLMACTPVTEQIETTQMTETAVSLPPPSDLLAHTWQLAAIGGEADDMFLPLPEEPAWLRFLDQPELNGTVGFSFEGFSGCNALFGSYTVSEATLTMDAALTQKGCEPEDLLNFENYMLAVLRHQPTFTTMSENGIAYLTMQLPDDESSRLVFQGVETAVTEPGCSEGGSGVFTPEDVGCLLANTDPAFVQMIDAETAVLFTDPQSIADWVGGAIIYHIPTLSTLVLDRLGDVDPQFSHFSNRAGLAALSEVAGNATLMADFKQQVQTNWETTPPNELEIRLSTAWQDGDTTIFLISIAGLAATDDRFYCASQTWTIDDVTVEVVADCMAHEPDTPVNQVLFESREIKGNEGQSVQVALNGMPSNALLVQEGALSEETAVYQTILKTISPHPLLVRGKTAPGDDGDMMQLETAVSANLLQNYQTANETPASLRFLFQNSDRYFVNPSTAIERNFLPAGDLQETCEQFRKEYSGLGGVVTLSGIGMSQDGEQAFVHALHECGSNDREAAYYTLVGSDTTWQILHEDAID